MYCRVNKTVHPQTLYINTMQRASRPIGFEQSERDASLLPHLTNRKEITYVRRVTSNPFYSTQSVKLVRRLSRLTLLQSSGHGVLEDYVPSPFKH